MNLSELTPDPRNANKGTERGRNALEHSLRSYGAGRSILLDKHGTIIAGNKTAETAADIGIDEVVVVETDGNKVVAVKRTDLDLAKDPAARELAYADNRVSELDLDFDPQAILTDLQEGVSLENLWSQAELDQMLKDLTPPTDAPEAQTDRAAELQEKWQTERGQVWEIGRHRLMCGDSTVSEDTAALFDGMVPDAVVTDPPYCSGGFQESGKSAGSVGTDAEHVHIKNDRLSTRGYTALLKSAFNQCDAPYLYAFTDWRMWVYLFDIAESSGFGVRSMIVWDKGTPGMGRGWRSQHELILWGCKKQPPFDKHASGLGNVLSVPRTGNALHTTEKPVDIIAALLKNCPFIRSAYDPFIGSGTTMAAAEQLNRTCYGMEMDPGYCGVVLERMSDTGLEPTVIERGN